MVPIETLFVRLSLTLVGTGALRSYPQASLGTSGECRQLHYVSIPLLLSICCVLHSVLLTDGVYVTHITPKTYYDGGLYGINVTVCLVVASSNEDVILSLNYSLVEPDIGNYQDVSALV